MRTAIKKISLNILGVNNRESKKPVGKFIAADKFSRIILEERERADRYGQYFSVIEFDISFCRSKSRALTEIYGYLKKRIRLSDKIGWLDRSHIGVILINSKAENAGSLAEKVNSHFHYRSLYFPYRVFFYPEENSCDGGDEGNEQKPLNGNHRVNAYNLRILLGEKLPVWKRAMDILISTVMLIASFPIWLPTIILIKAVSPGSAFFKQERVGYQGRTFRCWKFRTMKAGADTSCHRDYMSTLIKHADDSESGKPMTKLDNQNDDRIIPFGSFLRNSGLDELPQIINVLRGEMSLVGPRPPIPYEANVYRHWHTGRLNTVPGITGLWQVSGKNNLSFQDMVRLDIQYSRERSFLLDLKIMFMTPVAILQQIFPYDTVDEPVRDERHKSKLLNYQREPGFNP